jgi:CRISPR-associated protein (TIGR02710 family)
MEEQENAMPTIKAVLISVGGTPDPILFILRREKPHYVWYFCSKGSRPQADDIQRQLDWHPVHDFIELVRFEELGPCYKALRIAIPELLRKWKVKPEEVLVDYTCGTKTMSAALVLAGLEHFKRFSYIGGEQRDKGGLGVTVGGKERVFYQANPWSELAIREVEQAAHFWNSLIFEGAAEILRQAASVVPRSQLFNALADVCDGLAARHRLDFSGAVKQLGKVSRDLPLLFDGREDYGLIAFVKEAVKLCDDCKDSGNQTFLAEILDNSLRTARQHRFEDAAARLYRAIEMQGQIWLGEASGGAFHNGRLKKGSTLPEPLADRDFCRPRGDPPQVKLSLEELFRAAHLLGDTRVEGIIRDLERGWQGKLRTCTEKRNGSILGHGVQSISQKGFNEMKDIASEFLGFDLGRERHPIPGFDPRWLVG